MKIQGEHDFSVKKQTHQVIIKNLYSKHPDNKTFGLYCPDKKASDVYEILQKLITDKIFKNIFKDEVLFVSGDVNHKKSHLIVILPKNSVEDSSKSFTLKLTSYSSTEVLEIFKKFLYGEEINTED